MPKDQDMSPARHEAASGDWLDACCWRCGIAEALPDALGRILCRPCSSALSEPESTSSDDPLGVVRGAYWDAHALERCWRCLTESVEADDDVGLCRTCLATLSARDAKAGDAVTGG
jgi:hypothetical protein